MPDQWEYQSLSGERWRQMLRDGGSNYGRSNEFQVQDELLNGSGKEGSGVCAYHRGLFDIMIVLKRRIGLDRMLPTRRGRARGSTPSDRALWGARCGWTWDCSRRSADVWRRYGARGPRDPPGMIEDLVGGVRCGLSVYPSEGDALIRTVRSAEFTPEPDRDCDLGDVVVREE